MLVVMQFNIDSLDLFSDALVLGILFSILFCIFLYTIDLLVFGVCLECESRSRNCVVPFAILP